MNNSGGFLKQAKKCTSPNGPLKQAKKCTSPNGPIVSVYEGKGTYESALETYENAYGNLSETELQDEMASDFTEKLFKNEKDLLDFINHSKSLATKIKDMWFAILDKLNIPHKENARSLWEKCYKEASKEAHKGESSASGDVRYKTGSQKIIYDYSKTFAEQLDDLKNGLIQEKDTLIVGGTPDVYVNIGFNKIPITMAQGHIKVALDPNSDADHYLGEAGLKQLPEALKKPVAIIRSVSHPGRVVALLPMKQNGKTVIAPFEVDGSGRTNNILIDSNAMATAFGKGNILKQLEDALNSETNGKIEMYFWNKKEAVTLMQMAGLQLPGDLPRDGFIHSIREKGANINIKFENVTKTQQFKRWFGKSKAKNADGSPMILYHQTAEDIEVFDTRHEGAGSSDGETPYGVYLKPTPDDIGLEGKNQMALYARIVNPLTVKNREELVNKVKKFSPEYAKLHEQRKTLDTEYGQKVEDTDKEITEYLVEWKNHSGNTGEKIACGVIKRNALYNN